MNRIFWLATCVVMGQIGSQLFMCNSLRANETLSGDDRAQLKAIAEGYLANRALFTRITTSYIVSYGVAESFEDALLGCFEVSERLSGKWVVDGDKERCSLVNERELASNKSIGDSANTGMDRGEDGIVPSARQHSFHFTGDDQDQMSYSPEIQVVNLSTSLNRQMNSAVTPWNMGIMGDGERMSPGKLILSFLDQGKSISVLGQHEIRGRNGIGVQLTDDQGKTIRVYVDPDQGFLPLNIKFSDDFEVYVLETVKLSEDRWFPMRSVEVTPNKGTGKSHVREVKVTEIDVKSVPQAGEFALVIPAKTRVINLANKDQRFVLNDEATVTASELADLSDTTADPPPTIGTVGNIKTSGQSQTYNLFIINLVCLVLVGGAFMMYQRLKRVR